MLNAVPLRLRFFLCTLEKVSWSNQKDLHKGRLWRSTSCDGQLPESNFQIRLNMRIGWGMDEPKLWQVHMIK